METESNDRDASRGQVDRYIDTCEEYTHSYEREKIGRDWEKKNSVAAKVVEGFKARAGDPAGKRVLDIGFGNGAFVCAFARAGAIAAGVEVNEVLMDIAREKVEREGLQAELKLYDGHRFPFEDGSFDYAFSTSVLEHVDSAHEMLSEAGRTLKRGGRLYLAFPNRIALRETHTGILFLNYLPRSAARCALRRFWGRNTIDELNLHFIGYLALRRALRGTGLSVVPELEATSSPRRLLKRVLWRCGLHPSAVLRTIMVILEKES